MMPKSKRLIDEESGQVIGQLSRKEQRICNSKKRFCAACFSEMSLTKQVCSALGRIALFYTKKSPNRRTNREFLSPLAHTRARARMASNQEFSLM
jgi:hypothetical protein